METIVLIILVVLLLAFIGKSLDFVKSLIEFFKKDDIKNIAIGGAVLTIAIGIFFGNIAFFITLALFIAMLFSEYKKSSLSVYEKPSSNSGLLSSMSQTFQKFKNDVNSDKQERKLKSQEIQERKMAERKQYQTSQSAQSKSTPSSNFSKASKEQPVKQKWVVRIKQGQGSNTWQRGPTFDDYNKAQWWAESKKKSGTDARVEPA